MQIRGRVGKWILKRVAERRLPRGLVYAGKKGFDIPLILKGIATAEDAKLAVEHGVDCV